MVRFDSITPLSELIKKLEKPWDFNETFKAYWIGYTDDMYSIALYKDKAIEKLTDFIDTSHNVHAKDGALYTLHLIGINFRVVGRFSEDFEDKNAREALLKYLDDKELNETVMFLIMRDPWLSDIPKLMEYLSEPDRDYAKVLSALQRYAFKGKPFDQEIKDTIFNKGIDIASPDASIMQSMYALIAFQNELKPYLIVDNEIIESKEWKKSLSELAVRKTQIEKLSFEYFISWDRDFSYCEFNKPYYYRFIDHKVEIYGPIKARQIWLDWWQGLQQSEKKKLFSSNHVN